ncbi:M3 family peptidase [Citricoccus sp. SGAir0253]|uniref:M3 family metallopeptidase n=1 Tax=Citricoccus sp. SGAir0253 TaxID=2567881 RepID=UPI0010CCD844|nr:M3 family metallopeptidase [Citricoccus sp. SGAir0253]QCU77900.1 M3 family peptidase [Citricoccus sp. SGAir0253]
MTIRPAPANPLLAPSTLPYGLPDFRAIRDEHYLPAFRAAMASHRRELEAIAAGTGPATFEDTVEALERAGQDLRRVAMAFGVVRPADGTEARLAILEQVEPELAAHWDAVHLDGRLYRRLAAVDVSALAGEERRLAEQVLRDFRLRGADLAPAAQERLAALNERLAVLSARYERRLVAGTAAAAVYVRDAVELAGLPEQDVAAAAAAARAAGHDGGHLLALSLFTSQPWLEVLEDRGTRRRVFEAAWSRGRGPGEHGTLELAAELAALRAEKAGLLGFSSWAEYALQDRSAPDLDAVRRLLESVIPPAVANARRERAELEELAGHPVEPWDWPYYAARAARERRRVDVAALRPYLELDRVLTEGVFAAAGAMYGLSFRERPDLPGYHPDVRTWEVLAEDGAGIGLYVGDFHARPTKSGGAWMDSFRVASSLLGERPVVTTALNVPRPPAGRPALLTPDEVTTLFHEFGHALHGLLSTARYASLSGTAVPRDVVEFPSQVNEAWKDWPSVVERYARHVETGEPLPAAVRTALEGAAREGEGFRTTEYLGATMLDLAWHSLSPGETVADPEAFEAERLLAAGLDPALVPPRYRTGYFRHVFAGGYAAGYYSYLWAEVLDADAVEWFRAHGGPTRENGEHFRAEFLGRGNTRDPMESYRAFRGADPDPAHLLRRRGLAG